MFALQSKKRCNFNVKYVGPRSMVESFEVRIVNHGQLMAPQYPMKHVLLLNFHQVLTHNPCIVNHFDNCC